MITNKPCFFFRDPSGDKDSGKKEAIRIANRLQKDDNDHLYTAIPYAGDIWYIQVINKHNNVWVGWGE
jgi:hypothetical protein